MRISSFFFTSLFKKTLSCVVLGAGILFCFSPAARADVPEGYEELSKEPFPSRDLRIYRKWESKSVFTLYVENVKPVSPETVRARMKSYMVAGVQGKTPIVKVLDAQYDCFSAGEKIPFVPGSKNQSLKENLVRIADLGTLRQYYTYSFNFVLSTKLNDELYQLKNALIRVDIGEAPSNNPCEITVDQSDKGLELFDAMLINPDVSSGYYVCTGKEESTEQEKWISTVNSYAQDNRAFRLTLYSDGLYKLRREDLQEHSTGTLVAKLPPATQWHIYRNGNEIPVLNSIDDPEDEVFIPVFDGTASGLSSKAVWVLLDKETKKKPLRLNPATFTPPSGTITDISTTASFTHLSKKLTDYNPRLKPIANASRWVWESIADKKSKILSVNLPDFFPETEQAKVTLSYGFSLYQPTAPTVVLYINGREVARNVVNQQQGDVAFTLFPGALNKGKNDIGVFLMFPQTAERKDPIAVQSLAVSWGQKMDAPSSFSQPFELLANDIQSSHGVLGKTLNKGELLVRSINGMIEVVPISTDGLKFEIVPGVKSYAILNPKFTISVPQISPIKPNTIFSTKKVADYVAITHESLLTATKHFTDWHKSKGLDTSLVNVQEIYDAFTYGNESPQSIKSYLRHQFYQPGGTKLKYVFLVGEASDFMGDPELMPEGGQINLIPTATADKVESIQGDHKYAAVIGDDNIGDFMVGRLSAANVREVNTYFDKYMGYVQRTSEKFHWPAKAAFVLDDNDEFPVVVKQVIEEGASPVVDPVLFEQSEFPYIQYPRVQGKKRSYQATEKVIDLLNEGGAVVNYFGHGGPNLWSHERLLHLSDLNLLKDGGHTPFITCASCDNAWLSYPVPPVKNSMGELLVKQKNGGAIALFGPVSGASPYEHLTLVEYFMDGISKAELRRVGQITLYAKNLYFAQTRSASIPDQYVLIGDPAIDLDIPTVKPGLNIQISSSDVNSDILITPPQTDQGGVVTLYDFNQGKVVATQEVAKGQTFSVVRMSKLKPGTYGAVYKSNGDSPELLGKTLTVDSEVMQTVPFNFAVENLNVDVKPANPLVSAGDFIANQPAVLNFFISNLTSESLALKANVKMGDNVLGTLENLSVTTDSINIPFSVHIPTVPPGTDKADLLLTLETVANDLGTTDTQTSATNPILKAAGSFSLPVKNGPSLSFVPGSAQAESFSGKFFVTETYFLKANLTNNGDLPASNIMLKGFRDAPTTGTELVTINDAKGLKIESLLPGETKEVVFRWEDSHRSGPVSTFLTASLVGKTNDIASIQMPEFTVTSLPNFTVSNVSIYPVTAVVGAAVKLNFTVHDESETTRGPVSVEYGWRNSLTGETSSSVEVLPWIEPGIGNTLTQRLITPLGFNDVYVKVNSTLEMEESNPGDNTVIVSNAVVLDSHNAMQSPILQAAGKTYNLNEVSPTTLRVSDVWTSTSVDNVTEIANVVAGPHTNGDAPDDNLWTVQPWRLAASENESLEPITLRFPLPNVPLGTLVDINSMGFAGPGINEINYEVFDPIASEWKPVSLNSPFHVSLRGFVGTIPSGDGYIDVQVKKPEGKAVHIQTFDFSPQTIEFSSPVIFLPDTKPGQMNFGINIPGVFETSTKVQFGGSKGGHASLIFDTDQSSWSSFNYSWRFGKRNLRNGQIVWEDWSSDTRDLDYIDETFNVYQARILAVPKAGEKPYLENIRLKFK